MEINKEFGQALSEGIAQSLLTKGGDLTIRDGKALELKEPVRISIKGILNSPFIWLQKRIDLTDQKAAHIIVDRNNMTIELIIDAQSYYRTIVSGGLELHPAFLKFGINKGEYKNPFQMADLIKMNRSFFENHSIAMTLVTELKNFKAKVEKAVEVSDNNRGNKRALVDQIVASNIPETFTLVLPIFKGLERVSLKCEVYINAEDLTCTLISPEANDLIEQYRDSAIDAVLKDITAIAPDIAIIEQ